MKYILDTDTIIYFLKNHDNVVNQITSKTLETLHTTIINRAELLFGAFNSLHKKRNLDVVENFIHKITLLPFCEKSCYIFAEQKALLKKTGHIIADLDLIIASISLANHATIVTNNVKHFNRINSLKIANWTKSDEGHR